MTLILFTRTISKTLSIFKTLSISNMLSISKTLSARLLPPAEDERGSTLSVVILFPFVLILVLLILQLWAVSTARTSAQIAADEALRSAQEYAGIDRQERLNAGVNSAVNQLTNRVTYIDTQINDSAAKICEQFNEAMEARALSVIPEDGVCDETPTDDTELPDDAIIGVRIIDDELIEASVNVDVVTFLGGVSLVGREINTYACGLLDPVIWAAQRSNSAIPDDYCINR